jgi:hypothetical protein
MKIQQMLNSFSTLEKVVELNLPFKKAYKIYSLIKKINEERDFFIKEERKLVDKFNAEILENGNIKFNSAEDQENFLKDQAEILGYEVEGFEPIELSFDDLGDAKISPKEIMQLEGVINFVE